MASNNDRSKSVPNPPSEIEEGKSVDGEQGGREQELLAKLARAEKAALEAEERLQEHLANQDTSGLRVRNESGPFRGDHGGWRFRIGPAVPELHPHLKTITENACDESELKRWYCATNQDPPKSGKQVDPVKVNLKVECLDPGRKKLAIYKQRLSNIREKLESGSQLSAAEQDLLNKHEAEILGYDPEDLD